MTWPTKGREWFDCLFVVYGIFFESNPWKERTHAKMFWFSDWLWAMNSFWPSEPLYFDHMRGKFYLNADGSSMHMDNCLCQWQTCRSFQTRGKPTTVAFHLAGHNMDIIKSQTKEQELQYISIICKYVIRINAQLPPTKLHLLIGQYSWYWW